MIRVEPESADGLVRALCERDAELGIHVRGVADLACATARQLGVADEDMRITRETALLHDVGKTAIPDKILNKPRVLDDAEWAVMKRHTIIGERIVSAAPGLAPVARLVRSTHECFDGSGYPDGLAGDDIPLIARIVAVCDAYDAIVTGRPYREARDPATAIAELPEVLRYAVRPQDRRGLRHRAGGREAVRSSGCCLRASP